MRIIYNRIRCKLCGDQIESKTLHDFVMCSCGSCGVDGGQHYLRRYGKKENITELSVMEEDSQENESLSSEKNHC